VTRVGQAGLGAWGKNLARNFDELAELAWLCDADLQAQSFQTLRLFVPFFPVALRKSTTIFAFLTTDS